MRGWNLAAPKTEQMGYSGSIYKIEFFAHFSIGVSKSNESLLWWPKNASPACRTESIRRGADLFPTLQYLSGANQLAAEPSLSRFLV